MSILVLNNEAFVTYSFSPLLPAKVSPTLAAKSNVQQLLFDYSDAFPHADAMLQKYSYPLQVAANNILQYELIITNIETLPLQQIMIHELLDERTSYIPGQTSLTLNGISVTDQPYLNEYIEANESPSHLDTAYVLLPDASVSHHRIVAAVPLTKGDQLRILIKVRVPALIDSPIMNRSSLAFFYNDPLTSQLIQRGCCDPAEAVTSLNQSYRADTHDILTQVQLTAVKTAVLDACQTHITYTLTLTNAGNESAKNLKIQDFFPDEVYLPNINGQVTEGVIEIKGAALSADTFPIIDQDNILYLSLDMIPAASSSQPGIIHITIHGDIIAS